SRCPRADLTGEAARPRDRPRQARRPPAQDRREGGSCRPALFRRGDRAPDGRFTDRLHRGDRRGRQGILPRRGAGSRLPHRLARALRPRRDRGARLWDARHRAALRLRPGASRRRPDLVHRRYPRGDGDGGAQPGPDRPGGVPPRSRGALHRRADGGRLRVPLPKPGRAGALGMSESLHGDFIAVDDQYYILASTFTADLPKLVLKHDEAFFVADRRGDFPDVPVSEFGFYVGGTRFLDRFDLRLHGQRPLLLNSAVSGDNLQVAVDLTNADVHDGDTILLAGRTLHLGRRLTLYGRQLSQILTIANFAAAPVRVDLDWRFGADFVDVF